VENCSQSLQYSRSHSTLAWHEWYGDCSSMKSVRDLLQKAIDKKRACVPIRLEWWLIIVPLTFLVPSLVTSLATLLSPQEMLVEFIGRAECLVVVLTLIIAALGEIAIGMRSKKALSGSIVVATVLVCFVVIASVRCGSLLQHANVSRLPGSQAAQNEIALKLASFRINEILMISCGITALVAAYFSDPSEFFKPEAAKHATAG